MSCSVWYCTSPNHWLQGKALWVCTAPNRWSLGKAAWLRERTAFINRCATSKPVVGAPGNHSVTAGTVVHWAATASNYDTLQWQYKNVGGAWTNHGTHRGLSWATTPVNIGQNGEQFRLAATNKFGTTYGPAGTMTVKAAANPVVVGHINDPKNVAAGSRLDYTTSASGGISYGHWYKKPVGGKWTVIPGTSSKPGSNGLIVMGGHMILTSHDNGAVVRYCAFDSGGHSHCTNDSHLHVSGGGGGTSTPVGGGSKPRIAGMANIHITIPHAFQFHPHITGAGHIAISWQYRDGNTWKNWGTRHTANDGSGSAESPRTTRYRVCAKNAGGTVCAEATLTAVRGSSGHTTTPTPSGSKPTVGHLGDVHITDGQRYTFAASVHGQTSISWWYRKGSSGSWLRWDGHGGTRETGGPVSGTTMNGWYFKLQAANSHGHVDSNVARLFVARKTSTTHTTPTPTFVNKIAYVHYGRTGFYTCRFNGRMTAHTNSRIQVRITNLTGTHKSVIHSLKEIGNPQWQENNHKVIFSVARYVGSLTPSQVKVEIRFPAGAISIDGHPYVDNNWHIATPG